MTWKLKNLKTGKFVEPKKNEPRSLGTHFCCTKLMLSRVYPKGWSVEYKENSENSYKDDDIFLWTAKLWTVKDEVYTTEGNEKYEVSDADICEAVNKVFDMIGEDAEKFGYEIVWVD